MIRGLSFGQTAKAWLLSSWLRATQRLSTVDVQQFRHMNYTGKWCLGNSWDHLTHSQNWDDSRIIIHQIAVHTKDMYDYYIIHYKSFIIWWIPHMTAYHNWGGKISVVTFFDRNAFPCRCSDHIFLQIYCNTPFSFTDARCGHTCGVECEVWIVDTPKFVKKRGRLFSESFLCASPPLTQKTKIITSP